MVYRSPDVLTRLYKSLVRPHLEYCVSAWSPYYVKDWERLKRVQHRFTRMVPGLKGLDYGARLEMLNLMTLAKKRNRSDLVELFRISKGLSAISRNSFFRADNSQRTRGHSMKLAKERFRLDSRKHFFSQRVVNRWNGLSEEVLLSPGTGDFQEKIGWTEEGEEGSKFMDWCSLDPRPTRRMLWFGRPGIPKHPHC